MWYEHSVCDVFSHKMWCTWKWHSEKGQTMCIHNESKIIETQRNLPQKFFNHDFSQESSSTWDEKAAVWVHFTYAILIFALERFHFGGVFNHFVTVHVSLLSVSDTRCLYAAYIPNKKTRCRRKENPIKSINVHFVEILIVSTFLLSILMWSNEILCVHSISVCGWWTIATAMTCINLAVNLHIPHTLYDDESWSSWHLWKFAQAFIHV